MKLLLLKCINIIFADQNGVVAQLVRAQDS